MPVIVSTAQSPTPPLAPGELGWAGYPAGVVLDEWPIDIGELRLGRVDEFGGLWNITAFAGHGSAPTDVQATQRTTGHGAWIGDRWYAAKPYTIDVGYEGGARADRDFAEARLLSAVQPDGTAMVVHKETPYRTDVLLNGELSIDPANTYAFTAQIPLLAPDPFRYAVEPFEAFTLLPTQIGGATWPKTWPATWDAVVVGGTMTLVNSGNREAFPTFKAYGPLPDFSLTLVETGERFAVDFADSGGGLDEGEWVEVDMRRRRVMLLGQTSLRRAVTGTFFSIQPGTSTVAFGSTSYNATAFVEAVLFSTSN